MTFTESKLKKAPGIDFDEQRNIVVLTTDNKGGGIWPVLFLPYVFQF